MKHTLKRKLQQLTASILTALLLLTSIPLQAHASTTQRTFTPAEIDQWITVTSSVLNYHNHRIPDLFRSNLAAATRRQAENNSSRILSGNNWNVHSRADLVRVIESFVVFGHNGAFWDEVYNIAPLMLEVMDNPRAMDELLDLIDAGVLDARQANHVFETWDIMLYWGEAGIIAWDMFRIGNLIVWGYHAGHLNREQAREQMLPAIHILTHYFDSWEDAVANYLDGLLYWRGSWDSEVEERHATVERMFANPNNLFDNSMFD